MTMGLFDTHAHLSAFPLREQVDAHLERARTAGVSAWVVPGVRPDDWGVMAQIAERHADVWLAPGIHPMEGAHWNSATRDCLKEWLGHPRTVAVGEIGLDKRLATAAERQEEVFLDQVRLADGAGLPLLVHCCRRYGRLFHVLDAAGFGRGGIMHGFSGSAELAREAWNRGFALGIGGLVTRPEARRLREAVRTMPPEAMVLETDAPDGAPQPYRGEVNRLEWLLLIAEEVARLRGWSLAETAAVTTENARRQLSLPSD